MLFRRCFAVTFLAAVITLGLLQASAFAQSRRTGLPNENELNRLGLTMSWWGQAAVKGNQETVSFFTADEQNVYVQSGSGILTTFQGESGRRLWSQLVGRPNEFGYAVTSGDNDVLIAIGLKVHAFNRVTGVPTWELTLPSPPSASPKEDEKFVYVPTVDGMLRCYDVQQLRSLAKRGMLPQWTNRAEKWAFQMAGPSNSTPIPVDDDVVFASVRGHIYRMSGAHKKLIFQAEAGENFSAPITFSRDYVFAADVRSRLRCVSIKNGQLMWSFSSGAPIKSQPRVVGKQIFVTPTREGLSVLDITTGLRVWQQPAALDVVAVTDTRVYSSDSGKNLLILDRETGRILGQLRISDFSIRVKNDRTDRIYLANSTGTVIALREMGSEFPLYHLYPERRPILPPFAADEEEPGTEKPAETTKSNESL